jgi:hypothetical protein
MHLRQIVIVLTVSILRKGIPVMVIVTIVSYIGRKHQMMGFVGVRLERSDWYEYFTHNLYVSVAAPFNSYSFMRNYLLDQTIIKSVRCNRSLEET